jgi:Txe/YoeB family toxin of Txe-Axe toxin-antitoxin module
LIDLNYRPNSYFWAYKIGVHLSSQIKGSRRKTLYEASVDEDEINAINDFLSKPTLSLHERDFKGRLHPSFMGGEFLPDRVNGEIEIARITLRSITEDVTCLNVRLRKNGIYYQVVDEYDGDTIEGKSKTLRKLPMTLGEMTDFFLNAWRLIDVLEMNFGERFQEDNFDSDEVRMFISDASSSFYAQFGELVYSKVDDWIAKKEVAPNKKENHELIEESKSSERKLPEKFIDTSDLSESKKINQLTTSSKEDRVMLVEEPETLEDQLIKEWIKRVDKSNWPRSRLRDGLGLGARAEGSQRKKAVFQFVKKYLNQNKVLPTGTHIIDEVVPTLSGDFSGIPSKFNLAVNFPRE